MSIDYYHGYYIGLHHLIDKGCKNLLVIGLPENEQIYSFHDDLLTKTSIAECAEAGVELTIKHTSEEAFEYLAAHPEIDGIFSHADSCYIKLMKRFKELGRVPGKDIALISFDGVQYGSTLNPSLATIVQPVKEIARTVFDMFETWEPGQHPQHLLYPYFRSGGTLHIKNAPKPEKPYKIIRERGLASVE